MEQLKIALIHPDVRYADTEHNRRQLVELNREAAENGARILVNTELGVSGYSFSSREEVAPYAEPQNGPTARALAEIATTHGCYIALGYAEEDPATGIYYNAVAVIGPDGMPVLNYRKITAEVRWACAGDPLQRNVFDTPWGRVGVMICSDTYYGSIPRMSALRGADLLLVSANWPGGSLDPKEIWQARARENGFFLAACNRTGRDRTMECEEACSCVYAADGGVMLEAASPFSTVFHVSLPLVEGRIPSERAVRLRHRTPERYRPLYLDMRYAADMTAYCRLPGPGMLQLLCQPVQDGAFPEERCFEGMFSRSGSARPELVVFSAIGSCGFEEARRRLSDAAGRYETALCTGFSGEDGRMRLLFCDSRGRVRTRVAGHDDFDCIDLDHARIALAGKEELYHPEAAITLAKGGCDLVVTPADFLDDHDQRVLGSRSIEQVAIGACASNRSFVSVPPVEHYRWAESCAEGGAPCAVQLDVPALRRKHFYDRLDTALLLGNTSSPEGTVSPEHGQNTNFLP